MEFKSNTQFSPFNEACQAILFDRPEAIGVAYKVLDCGCYQPVGIRLEPFDMFPVNR
jgi:hypothetical protein